jgi:hypothetical protein
LKEFQFYDERSGAFILNAIKSSGADGSKIQIIVHSPLNSLNSRTIGILEAHKSKDLFAFSLLYSNQPSFIIRYTGKKDKSAPRDFYVQCYPNGSRTTEIRFEQASPILQNGKNRFSFGRSEIIPSTKNFILKNDT